MNSQADAHQHAQPSRQKNTPPNTVPKTVVSFHAHPDDEALLCAGWLAQRAAAGDRVVLAFATDGGAGLSDGTHADLAARRRGEAEASAAAIGAAEVVWLGWDDSGMEHDPSQAAHRFVEVPVTEAAARLVRLLDAERATVLTGYDALGGYGHPDHVHVHRVARAAQAAAARRPQLWEATRDRTWLVRGLTLVRPLARLLPGITLPSNQIYSAPGPALRRMDVRDQIRAKQASLRAHDSQTGGGIRTVAILAGLPGFLARPVLGTEWFLEVD